MMNAIDTGRWMEPQARYACRRDLQHSGDLVRVIAVKALQGKSTICLCATHHGELFECPWVWLDTFWQYAGEPTDYLESGFDSV